MPIGVPKVLYYWDDELPLQWVDLYHLIFRRRLVFVMSELDQDLCNQIAGMMVYIHFEDKRDELENQGNQARDLFSSNLDSDLSSINSGNKSYRLTYQDLMDYDNIWDLESGMEKDYYMDLYNSENYGDSVWTNDYNENALFLNKKFSNSLDNVTSNPFSNFEAFNIPVNNSFDKSGENITLKQYSNFFNLWLPLVPVLNKYVENKNHSEMVKYLSDNLKSVFGSTEKSFFSSNAFKNDEDQKLIMYQGLKYYLEMYQRTKNRNESFNHLIRSFVKENVKKAYYQDMKDQKVQNLTAYSKVVEDMYISKNLQQKKSESEDLLFMETQERLKEQSRVFVFINSTGGSVTSGITIYDALQFVKTGAVTVCLGMAFSASSMVLAGGNIGHRYVAEGAHVMIHQPEGGITGQASDVLLDAYEILRIRRQVATIYSLCSKRALGEVLKDLDRDNFMTPQEAVDYGLADEIVTRYNSECILDEFEKDWFAHDAKQIEGISKKIQQQEDEDEPTTAGSESLF
uniref:ATP-dependent Clp protease proteolytic subunit n=1 Tax=Aphanochaete confervicola TaxID=764104 RepID=A0A6H1XE14_9CHLO|nr:proteolytic subunit 2 of clp protease [Aphanochaete confervicola]QJA13849.1 proteolytic subunit 2 of clp protease [Aphanochaete confervicola]